jgi:peptidoglycan hydrolase CwlO-like protein
MRALKRAQDERELAGMKQKDIEKLQAEIDDLQQKREELLARIAKYAQHSKYLEKVSAKSHAFTQSTMI